jgi:hypothetical protein
MPTQDERHTPQDSATDEQLFGSADQSGVAMLPVVELSLDEIEFDPLNFRVHDAANLALIQTSLEENGAGRSLFARLMPDGTTRLIAGEGTIRAARAAGFKTAVIVDVPANVALDALVIARRAGIDDEQALRMAAFDNATGETSYWDTVKLGAYEIESPGFFAGIFDDDAVTAFKQSVYGDPEAPPKEVPVEFTAYDDGLETQYQCPNCHYAWSGKPK